MIPAPLNRLLRFILVEAVLLIVAYFAGHQRTEDFLNYYTGMQLAAVLMFIIAYLPVVGFRYMNMKQLTVFQKIKIGIITLVIIGVTAAWIFGIFPGLVNNRLRNHGVDSLASIKSWRLVTRGSHGAELGTTSETQADAIVVKLVYGSHSAMLSEDKGSPAFDQLYKVASQTGGQIPVRYLKSIPSIVQTKTELNMPGAATVSAPVSQNVPLNDTYVASADDMARSKAIADQFITDMDKLDANNAYQIEAPPFQFKNPVSQLAADFKSMNIAGYQTKAVGASATGTSGTGHHYVSYVYDLTYSDKTHYYVWVLIENYNGWSVDRYSGDTKPIQP